MKSTRFGARQVVEEGEERSGEGLRLRLQLRLDHPLDALAHEHRKESVEGRRAGRVHDRLQSAREA